MSFIIKPFRAFYYNPSLIKNLSKVVCPPYDVIDKRQLRILRKQSPYNFSHILLAPKNNYKKVREKFKEWLEKKILIKDEKESLYLYKQSFKCEGKRYSRFGIISLLRMDKEGVVFPHEYTLKEPKEDRKRIIEETQANLSPIFVVIPESLDIFSEIYKKYSKRKTFLKFKDREGNFHWIWRIEERKDIEKVCNEIEKYKLVIADGHHRFEVAYRYYLKNKNKFKDLNYLLAYLTDAQKGLFILPTHRIGECREDVLRKLDNYFYWEEVAEKKLEKRLKENERIFCFGIYKDKKFYFLKLKKKSLLDKITKNKVYQHLDTYLLHKFVFPLLKIKKDKIKYTHSVNEAKEMVKGNKIAFLLRPTPLKVIHEIATRGLRLPQKSTYFYPKVGCGLLIRKFEK
jgi:uncharacterized protein (DUF1015 family)